MKKHTFLSLFLSSLLAASVSTASAQGKGRGHHKGDDEGDSGGQVTLAFSSHDRVVIGDWFHDHGPGSGLPPGLAKRDRLPPGLEKQLRERGSLPPGLQKKLQPLPADLERRLPPCPSGYQRGIIGAHVVLVGKSGSVVVDMVRDVVPY